jgi:predicted metal-dependent phosphoesterase TrpH
MITCFPRVVKANQVTTFSLSGFDLAEGTPLELSWFPLRHRTALPYQPLPKQSVIVVKGQVTVTQTLTGQQEIKLTVFAHDHQLAEFRLYVVEADLWSLNPYKGDLHMHSTGSDGVEAPAIVAAKGRSIGLDFMALTDHANFAPSIEAQEAYRGIPLDMALERGEEVHGPGNGVHIIHYGGSESVNTWLTTHPNAIEAAVKQAPDHPDPRVRREIALSHLTFDRIRDVGGVAIFCHPYWQIDDGYHIAEEVTDSILKEHRFDAYEVIGGYWPHEVESNAIQVARYHHEMARGNRFPVVGVSDAHGCDRGLFGWYYTVVFAQSPRVSDVAKAIRSDRSVAVEARPGHDPRPVGDFELVLLTLYLLREYFPTHDMLCVQEGKLMLHHVEGDATASEKLARLKGQVAAYQAQFYGRSPS